MKGSRLEKLNKELQKAFGTFVERESNRQSLVTITRCDISPDLSNVIVFVSVFPTDHEDQVIKFLNRRKWDAREFLKKKVVIRVIPFVDFQLDFGEKNRQHIDKLLRDENVPDSETR
ncbi:MAG: ribosome-binding factor A [Candidatus Paceibacteria bacterium]|jgi:ribosome-binding factor A